MKAMKPLTTSTGAPFSATIKIAVCAALLQVVGLPCLLAETTQFEAPVAEGERVVLLGEGLGDVLAASGWLDAVLVAAYPLYKPTFRSLAHPGDSILPAAPLLATPADRPVLPSDERFVPPDLNRLRFYGHEGEDVWLERTGGSLVLLFVGRNEALDPEFTPERFRRALMERILGLGEGRRVALATPTLVERLPDGPPPPAARVDLVAGVMRQVAEEGGHGFADIRRPAGAGTLWPSYNGVHPDADSCRLIALELACQWGWPEPSAENLSRLVALRELASEKNRFFVHRHRPLNSEYILGRRNRPFGVVDHPPEMEKLDRLCRELDEEMHRLVGGATKE